MDTTSMLQRTLIIEAAPAPPDGGWGWVAVLAGFVCHLVIDGIVYSSGIFFDEFLTYFGEGHAATSWISSITFGCYLISSPVASGLTIRYGCRRIAILGSVMSSFGLFISVYATGIKFLYFSLGFITGTGFGFTLLPAIVCVTSYFDRRRSLATGITVCGSGVGTFVMAPLVQALVRVYGWKGTLIICSGLSLQGVVAGSLMRPVGGPSSTDSDSFTNTYEPSELYVGPSRAVRPLAVYDVSSSVATGEGSPPDALQLTMVPDHGCSETFKSRIRLRRDLFYEGSLPDDQRQPTAAFFSADSSLMDGTERRSQIVTLVDNRNIIARTLFSYQMAAVLGEMLNFRLLSDAAFRVFSLSRVFCGIGYSVPYLFLTSRAVAELGVSETDASFLLSVVGFTNVVGRVVIGAASDRLGAYRIWLFICCVMVCGLSTVLSVLSRTYTELQVYAATYGVAGGGFITLSSVVVVDMVGLDRLTNAYGLCLLCLGVAALVGPPLNGWVHDVSGSYAPGFILAGVSMYAAGVVLIGVPYLQSRKARRRHRSRADDRAATV
ncbi:monocarboxylate transporter 13-like [Dermacentor andersoni]|uniref:monocarboxylate transporter 13-like n=1 Tax=Dermacentor andersoni TaxID=34620 RepID=UPI003B3A8F51